MDLRIAECKHCGKVKHPDEFWCVINGVHRHYECKVDCKPVSFLPLEIEKREEIRPSDKVEDWTEAYPKETTFQKILRWILPGSTQYTKLKSQ